MSPLLRKAWPHTQNAALRELPFPLQILRGNGPCFLASRPERLETAEGFKDLTPTTRAERSNTCAVSPMSEIQSVSQTVVKIDPEIMSGAPCFVGTRVPIQNLIDYLEGGDSIDEFLEDFPSVTREQVISFLEEAKDSVLARAV